MANSPAEFWRLLRGGISAVSVGRDGRRGGFVADVDKFDAGFFGISPREAAAMDPQQRLVLELVWAALEDARIVPDTLRGSRTGVFAGALRDDYASLVYQRGTAGITSHTMTGLNRGLIANRVSYQLDLAGPSMTVDTAQSSSLVAVHLAVASLASGESELAVAAGVSLNTLADNRVTEERFGGLSPDGVSRAFDAAANGFAAGEGGAVVVLKPLHRARADGDRIHAVIRGTAMNHDGATPGLTVPDAEAQSRVIRAALSRAGVAPGDVTFVEAHGTGTPVGDPIEAAGLGAAIGRERAPGDPLLIGSVKTNIGHLAGAAGIAGLLKAVLAVAHRELPPSLHFRTPNPAIPLDELGLSVATEVLPLTGPVVAGVSSFGMGGANCHVVMADAPAETVSRRAAPAVVPWVVSARGSRALRAQARELAAFVTSERPDPADVGFSLATTRQALDDRAVVFASDQHTALAAVAEGRPHPGVVTGSVRPGGLGVLFAGQGTQRAGMGAGLRAAHPVFAAAFDDVCAHLDPRVREAVETGEGLDDTGLTQPALFAVEVALYRLVESWGVRPTHLVGHSVGEIAAAHVAGVLSLQDAARLVTARGRLMRELPPGGAMIAVRAAEEVVAPLVAGRADVGLAAVNGPESVVISGAAAACAEIAGQFPTAKRLAVSHAFHSPLMAPMLEEFRAVVSELDFAPPRLPIVSTVLGAAADAVATPGYWVEHVSAPVRYMAAVRVLAAAGVRTALEIGPDGTCSAMLRESTEDCVAVPALRKDRPEPEAFTAALATIFTRGARVDWAGAADGARAIDLPTYAFQRERHWFDAVHTARVEGTADPAELVRAHTAAVLGHGDPARLDVETTFRAQGFDSMMAIGLRDALSAATGLRLPSGLLFDHPTPAALTAHLARLLGDGVAESTVDVDPSDEPVAIVGMAVRYPGGVLTPDDLWRLVADEVDAVGGFPTDRGWPADVHDPDPDKAGHSTVDQGGFLADVAGFDAGFFGISPREALTMDPQQRLLLETSWEVVERAGIEPRALRGTATGVFVGATALDYGPRMHEGPGGLLTGTAPSVMSGRIAYHLGLLGPALTIDTACSSSLVALHLAVRSLRSGESSLAIAGGVTVMSTPGMFVEFSRQRGLAADGRSKAFAAAADGTSWAEGAGLLLVERLSDAVRNGRRIHAVIRGTAINSDGSSNGLTAPNGLAQRQVIRAALADAGLRTSDVDAVEAHGTGTRLGDPIEAEALVATYGAARDRPLVIGSLKSNIGHAQAAAGVGGVVKMVQAMRHGLLPRTLHVDEPTPYVDWAAGSVELLTSARPWDRAGRPRRAGVSSFGISGTNAHVIIEEPAEHPARTAAGADPVVLPWVVSARDRDVLGDQFARLRDHVLATGAQPADIAFSLAHTRTAFEHRAVVLGRTTDELLAALDADDVIRGTAGNPKPVYLFTGQGAQRPGMGERLAAAFPAFAQRWTAVCAELDRHLDRPLTEVVSSRDVDRTEYAQPALFAFEVAMAGFLGELGIRPDRLIGHSVGELAAAHVAGLWSLQDAARMVVARGRLMQAAPSGGAMVAIEATVDELTLPEGVCVASINGPAAVVISGDADATHAAAAEWAARGRRTKALRVSHAFHSHHMDGVLAEFREVATDLTYREPEIEVVPTAEGDIRDPGYWVRQIREPVRFHDAVRTLAEDVLLVEVGPDAALTAMTGAIELSRAQDEQAAFAAGIARLHVVGVPVDLTPLCAGGRTVELPTYGFRRGRYWLDAGTSRTTGHPLVSATVAVAGRDETVLTSVLSTGTHGWLAEHRIGDTIVVPATLFVELVSVAAGRVGELVLEAPLVLHDREVVVQVVVTGAEFTVHARENDETLPWTRHASGVLNQEPAPPAEDLTVWPPRAAPEPVDDVYDRLATKDYHYGPAFQGLRALWRADDTVYAEVVGDVERDGFVLHPAMLDAALHPAVLDGTVTRLPFVWTGIEVHGRTTGTLRVRITRQEDALSLLVADETGAPVVSVRSLTLREVDPAQLVTVAGDLFATRWRAITVPRGTEDVTEIGLGTDLSTVELKRTVLAHVPEAGPAPDHGLVEQAASLLREWLAMDTRSRLVFVTRGAEDGSPAAAAVSALVRSAQAEHPGRFGLVDTDSAPVVSEEPRVLVRGGRPHVPELARVPTGSTVDMTGTVLVTGGTGGLGALVARHLASDHGVRDLMLVSRRGPEAPGAAHLRDDLAALGAHVTMVAADVADRAEVERVLGLVPADRPLGAVVHAAGVLADATTVNMTPERIDAAFGPKADGAWHLHELTRDLPLTAFILFSSISGVLGTPGQANYAAANAYLDGLATHRHALGLPALSLAWGPWAEVGMGGELTATDRSRWSRSGVEPLTTQQGLALFDLALGARQPAVVPARLSLAKLARKSTRTNDGSWSARIAALPEEERAVAVSGLVRASTAAVLGHAAADQVSADRAFTELGLDSLGGLELRRQLAERTGLPLAATATFDHPTPAALTAHLLERVTGGRATAVRTVTRHDEPIAIIGMACRFPGGVRTPADLWRLVADGIDAISEFPDNRGWDVDRLYHPDPDHIGTSYTKHGGFLHDADLFDAEFFGMSPREALSTDPQHRLLLETAWETFESAGVDPAGLRGSATGVFVGAMYNDYASRLPAAPAEVEGFLLTGNLSSVVSGRLAYVYGLEGPAVTVDTACSSSLVGLHLAAGALRGGECDLALAGGVTVMSSPDTFVEFSRQRGLSVDGRCRSFGVAADGTGWSEGVGLLLVERLSDARRNGHRVLAVLRGSAVGSDGGSNGLTAPNGLAQERVIRQALAGAGLRPSEVDVVEAHGTGTALGDPIEANALLATYGQDRDRPLWLGSLKSNIGHAQAAAGVGGVIKVVEAMRHGVLPRTLHAEEPSPHVDWSGGAVSLLTENREWPTGPRRAGVSSFGISGTNAHVIIENGDADEPGPADGPASWLLSARDAERLRELAARLRPAAESARPADVGVTLATRSRQPHRMVLSGTGRAELLAALDAVAADARHPAVTPVPATDRGRTAFLFAGQGTQRLGVGRELYAGSAAFAAALDEVCECLDAHLPRPVRDVLFGADAAALNDTAFAQPALFAVEVALARLLREHGLVPDYLIGHSVGEVVAAHVSGVLDLADACRFVAARGRLMSAARPGGAMVSLRADETEARDLIAGRAGVAIAGINGPRSTVVSGDADVVADIAAQWRAAGGHTRALTVSHAFHSPHMDGILDEVRTVAAGLTFREPRIPVVSNVTGKPAGADELCSPEYWAEHIRATVLFREGMSTLAAAGVTEFVGVGPDASITTMARDCLADEPGMAMPVLRPDRPESVSVAAVLGVYAARGGNLSGLNQGGRLTELPGHPFRRSRYWLRATVCGDATGLGLDDAGHALLGAAVPVADRDGFVLTGALSRHSHRWLADHEIDGVVLVPGTAILDMALRAGHEAGCPAVAELTLLAPLVLPETGNVRVQVTVGEPDPAGDRRVDVYARAAQEWTVVATGRVTRAAALAEVANWPPKGVTEIGLDGVYDRLAEHGFRYGPAFQGLRKVWRGDGVIYAEVVLDGDHGTFVVPPALLDAALHPVLPGVVEPDAAARIPFAWSGVRVRGTAATRLRVRLTSTGPDTVALLVADGTGAPVAEVDSLVLRHRTAVVDGLYRVRWRPVSASTVDSPAAVVRLGGAGGQVAEALDVVRRWLADRESGRMVIVTRMAVAARAEDVPDLAQAGVWGLVRSAQTEHPGRFALVDTDTELTDDQLVSLAGEQVAVRAGTALAPALVRGTPGLADVNPWNQGTVLVTGATGALGRVVARHLVTGHAARSLLLVSRRGLGAPGAAALRDELAGLGAEVVVECCDVADRTALAAVLARVPVRAVVHTAGVLDDGVVSTMTRERLGAVLRPKIDAAVNLHELTGELSAFVLYSSVAGLLGTAGQANYAAGNAFLDALAAHRRAQGLPATSLAWGAWDQDGMAGRLGEADLLRLRRTGLVPLTPAHAMALFDAAVAGDEPLAVLTGIDPAAAEPHPLLRGLVRPARQRVRESMSEDRRALLPTLPSARRAQVVADLVRAEVAAVLGHADPAGIDDTRPFTELGFDSLTAVDLRNRLIAATGVRLSASLVFDHPSAAAVTRHVLASFDEPDDFGRLESALKEALTADPEGAGARLRRLLDTTGRVPGTDLDDASDDELFDLVDNL